MTRYDQPYMPGGFQVMPPAIKAIIIANVIVFLFQNTAFGPFLTTVGALWPIGSQNPGEYTFRLWQPISYLFLHGSFTHLFFNMFALWMFGAEIENYWGTKNFVTYYFICGVGAALINLVATAGNPYPTVGASGAIFGVLLAFGMMFPERYIYIYFLLPVKTKYFVAGYALIEFIAGFGNRTMGSGSNVAHFAHLGGMVVGYIYILIRRNDGSISRMFRKFSLPKKQNGPVLWQGGGKDDDVSEAEIDRILDKISSRGYDSLTTEEKRKLLKAGKR